MNVSLRFFYYSLRDCVSPLTYTENVSVFQIEFISISLFWTVGDVVKKSEKMALQTFDLPKRKEHTVTHGGNHVMKIITIAVNYLPLNIKNTKLKVYHYDVAFKPETPKYLLR